MARFYLSALRSEGDGVWMVYWRGDGWKQGWGVGVGREEPPAEAASSSTRVLGRLPGSAPRRLWSTQHRTISARAAMLGGCTYKARLSRDGNHIRSPAGGGNVAQASLPVTFQGLVTQGLSTGLPQLATSCCHVVELLHRVHGLQHARLL